MDIQEIMNSGKLYSDAGDGLPEKRMMGKARAYQYNQSHPFDIDSRNDILQHMFQHIGINHWIEPPINIAYGIHTSIGDNFYANFNLTLVDDAQITIGDNVMIAPNVTVSTAGHPIDPATRHSGRFFSLPVIIEDGVWLGTGVIINPGVTIGRDSVIGAGSVVTRTIPPGVPCRVLRAITPEDARGWE